MHLPPLHEDLARVDSIVNDRWERLRGQRVLVSGGTGFVGKWMLAPLADANRRLGLRCEVVVVTRDPRGFRKAAPWLTDADGFDVVQGDVRFLDQAPSGRFDRVIHAATDVAHSVEALETFDTCVQGTRRMLEIAKACGAESFLLVSSGAVYGRQPTDLPEVAETFSGAPDSLSRSSAYANGKRAAEFLAAIYNGGNDMQVKIARCFAFVGPYLPLDGPFAAGNFLGDALAGRPIVIKGDGTAVRSYMHASEMAAWLWLVLFDGQPGDAYNVGCSQAVSLKDLASLIVDATGSAAPVEVLGRKVPGLSAERYVPDVSKALNHFGMPSPITLSESLARTIRWHRSLQA